MLCEECGVDVTPRHVRTYDPTSFQCAASERLRALHAIARKRFEQEVADVPITVVHSGFAAFRSSTTKL